MIATRQFEIPVYGSLAYVIVFDKDWNKVIQKLNKIGFSTDDIKDWDFVYGLQLAETIKNRRRFVTILQKNRRIESCFVHELYHLTQDILDWKEVDYRKGGKNEAYAYLNETLYRKLIPFIKEHKPLKIAARKKAKKKK